MLPLEKYFCFGVLLVEVVAMLIEAAMSESEL